MGLEPEKQAVRKRRAVLEAASSVFLNKGYDSTTMDDVAAKAGVSKATVYKHFADKERLFAEIVGATTGQVDALVTMLTAKLADTRDLDRDLADLARHFRTALMQPRLLQLRRLVIANADRFPEVSRAWYEQGFGRVLAALATCFQRLADHGLLRLDDPRLAANHFVGLLLWIPINQAMFTGRHHASTDAEIDRHVRAAIRAFLDGYGGRRRKA
jgi:TetR/AcrR family transcriptional repressor of mexJK operon